MPDLRSQLLAVGDPLAEHPAGASILDARLSTRTPALRILALNPEPVHEIRGLSAGRHPGLMTEERIPVSTGEIAGLPDGIDAVVITSDLQVRETFADAGGH